MRRRLRALVRVGIARRDGSGGGSRRDQGSPRRRVLLREQAAQRHVEVVGVGEVGVAIGERVARRLEEVVLRLLARHRREVVTLEDVQRLTDRGAAARRRAHRPHVEPAVVDVGRSPLGRRVGVQVAHRDHTGPPDVVRGRADRWILNGLDQRVGDLPTVEPLRTEMRDPLVRRRELGVREDRADVARRAVGVEEERSAGRDVVEPVAVRLHLVEPHLVDHVAVAGDVDGGRQDLLQRHRAELLQRLLPGLDRAGDADGETAVAGAVEGQRRAVLPERRRVHRGRGRLAAVDRRDPAAGGSHDHEAAAADATGEGLGDAEDGGRGDSRVDGVATLPQDVDGNLCGDPLHRRGRSAGADSRGWA